MLSPKLLLVSKYLDGDLMALIKCIDCGKDVSTLAVNCPNCGRPVDEQQLPVPDLQRAPCPDEDCTGTLSEDGACGTCGKSADWRYDEEISLATPINPGTSDAAKSILFALVLGIGCIFFLLVFAFGNKIEPQKPSTVAPSAEQSASPEPTITTDQHLSGAKKALETDYQPSEDPMETKWGHVTEAEEHLSAITQYDNEQQKTDANNLLEEINRRNKEIDKLSKAVERKIAVQLRENLRNNLEKGFLELGWDVEVTLKGKEKDILNLKYVLFSKAMVYKLTNGNDLSEGSFLLNIKKSGFKRVHFTNNYDYGQYWDFTK